MHDYYKKRGYSDDEISEKVQKLLTYLEKVVLDSDMTVDEMIEVLTSEAPRPLKRSKKDMNEASSSEVFHWLEERQIDKGLVDDDLTEDMYDVLFVTLFDWYIIFMLFWRKIKWTARQVKVIHDNNSEIAAFVTQTATVYFTLDAVQKWSECKSTIDHSLKQGPFELSGSFEQMIEEEIKWEYIYQIEWLLRLIMVTPIIS